MEIELVQGDITAVRVDAIVNAANSSLLGGGGVDGAIHRRGGSAILAECRALRASRYGRGLPTGQAVATTAGNLPASWVVHTVGPVWSASEDRSSLLRDCYANSLRVADELGATSVAFPLISAGIYRWPVEDAVRQALAVLTAARPTTVTRARLVLFDATTHATAVGVRERLRDDRPTIGDGESDGESDGSGRPA
ncbi:O-acetyl-ADP-ribose deacetylase [Plantactinospora soyae]|nr:O-acetyl-ADP-ribose deacetylase [Plantactinospora soyae]